MTRLARQISLLAAATAITVASILIWMPSHAWHTASAVAFAAAVAAAILALRTANDATAKVTTMIEAMRNNDMSIRFPNRRNPEINNAFSEISEIIKNEKLRAKQKESYFGLIINQINAGIFVLDDNENVELCNDSTLHLLGLNVFTHASQLERVEQGLHRAISNMIVGEAQLISFMRNGSQTTVSAGLSKIELSGKMANVYVLNNVYSAIDRQEVDAYIKLTRVLTHEIMNSIAPIHSLSEELLRNGNQEPDMLKEGLGVISSTSKALIKFTESFRKFAAIPAPEKHLNYVDDLIKQSLSLMQNQLRGIDCETVCQEEGLIVESDANLVGQVLVNLLKNAIDAKASLIRICACCSDNESVHIEVSDNGIPVPADCIEQIFVPFFSTKTEGSGLGLAVSRRIMSLHGGTIKLVQPATPPYTKKFLLIFP